MNLTLKFSILRMLRLILCLCFLHAVVVFAVPQTQGRVIHNSHHGFNQQPGFIHQAQPETKKETPRQKLVRLLSQPPSHPDFKVITMPIIREFFKDRQLVNDLVECFDDRRPCKHAGMTFFIRKWTPNGPFSSY